MTAHSPSKQAKKNIFRWAGVLLFARVSKDNHMASKVANGLDTVVNPPGHSASIKLGNCWFSVIRTTSTTTSAPGAEKRSAPVAADTTN